jgi:hypothetical protein
MSDNRCQRIALLAARTRKRRENLHGPVERRTARELEDYRQERGRPSLFDAFGGIPSRTDFLKKADYFEITKGSRRVDHAFIVAPLDETTENKTIALYWYRRDTLVPIPTVGLAVRTVSKEGKVYLITPTFVSGGDFSVKLLRGGTFKRTCTGFCTAIVVLE